MISRRQRLGRLHAMVPDAVRVVGLAFVLGSAACGEGGSSVPTWGSSGMAATSSGGGSGSATSSGGSSGGTSSGSGASAGGSSGGGTSGSGGAGSGSSGSGLDAGDDGGSDSGGAGPSSDDGGAMQDAPPSAGDAGAGADPVAAGWTSYDPPKEVQIETADVIQSYPYTNLSLMSAGASYDRSNGIETFKLFNNDASNRVEVRVLDDYATGLRQFAGDVQFVPPTDNESLMQVFGETGGSSMLMLRGYAANGGTITKEGGHVVVATGVYGKWVHVNVVHDATQNNVSVYVDGALKGNWPSGAVGPDRPYHYHKYGCYGTLMTANAQVQWRKVAYYMK